MKSKLRILTLSALILSLAVSASQANSSIETIAKAQEVITKVNQILKKYDEMTLDLDAPEPIEGSSGKYVLPFTKEGELTAWAQKALEAKVGAALGAEAGKAVASKIPAVGGFLGKAMKDKGKELGAVSAIGGWDYIKDNSELSFNNLKDLAVWMQANKSGSINYQKALAAAMAIYPDLEKKFASYISAAYKSAKRAAKKK